MCIVNIPESVLCVTINRKPVEVLFFADTIRNMLYVVCFLLCNSLASEFYMPTFRNILFHIHRKVGILHTHLPMKMEHTKFSETSAYKIQKPGNYSEDTYLPMKMEQVCYC